ncbi:hypothetical protein B7486_56980 [cyanobacterium TDX16]|nr:hypothetical protein B7486_56980 [cyanobacterium TDX16]
MVTASSWQHALVRHLIGNSSRGASTATQAGRRQRDDDLERLLLRTGAATDPERSLQWDTK